MATLVKELQGLLLPAPLQPLCHRLDGRDASLRVHFKPAALVGLLIRLPDAFGLRAHHGMSGTGLLPGALSGSAAKMPRMTATHFGRFNELK